MLSRHNFDNIFKINKHRKQAEKLEQFPSVSKQKHKLYSGEKQKKSLVGGSTQIFLVSGFKAGKPGWVWFDMHLHCLRQNAFFKLL